MSDTRLRALQSHSFYGSHQAIEPLIGKAVPPKLAQALGGRIVVTLLGLRQMPEPENLRG
jgi:hypothetical protein